MKTQAYSSSKSSSSWANWRSKPSKHYWNAEKSQCCGNATFFYYSNFTWNQFLHFYRTSFLKKEIFREIVQKCESKNSKFLHCVSVFAILLHFCYLITFTWLLYKRNGSQLYMVWLTKMQSSCHITSFGKVMDNYGIEVAKGGGKISFVGNNF